MTGQVGNALVAGTVYTNAQPNITSVGTLTGLTLSGNVNMGTKNITSLADPVAAQDAATKNYVDTTAQGLDPKASVVYATTATLFGNGGTGYTYNNGTSGVGATLTNSGTTAALSIDGSTPTVGDRVLIKNESGAFVNNTTQSAAFNGIYTVTTVGTVSVAWVLTRSTDFDAGTEMPGAFVFVEAGTTNADTGWTCTTNNPITVGTTLITFVQFSGAGTYSAGTGLTLTGSTFSVNASQTQITSVGTLTSLGVSGTITAANITANTGVFTGNGNGLSSLVGANVTGQVGNALVAGTVYTNAQPNITSVGTLTSLAVTGNISVTGQLTSTIASGTAPFVVTSNTQVANLSVASAGTATSATTAGTVTTNAQPNITSVGTLTTLIVGNATANSTFGNGTITATGNVTVGNLIGVHANGNSNVNIATANGNVTIAAVGNTTLTVTGTGANIAGTANISGNANVGNIGAATAIFTTGNITTVNSGLLQNGTSNVTIASGANVSIFTAGNATAQFVVTSTGANIPGTANVVGNANVGNIGATQGIFTTSANIPLINSGNSNITLTANGNVSTYITGNATAQLVVTATGANIAGYANVVGNIIAGNVGIGISSPNQKLQVNNPAASSSFALFTNSTTGSTASDGTYFGVDSSGLAYVWNQENSAMLFGTNNGERMRIDANGNVGIGTNSANPASRLDVSSGYIISGTSTSTAGTKILAGYYSSGHIATFGSEYSSGGPVLGYGVWPSTSATGAFVSSSPGNLYRGAYTIAGNTHIWYGGSQQTVAVDSAVTMAEAMRIDSTGNVGIGNTAPTNKLSVTGTAYVSGNLSVANVTASGYYIRSVATGISAAGTVQANATALTKEMNIVSTVASGAGVVMPTAVAGMVLTITNTSANSLLVYPASGGTINSLATNGAFTQVAGATLQFIAPTTTQWYTVGATYA